eukprot:GFYU01025237.1.p1 GENE.GFYU01025237.1~~GFYU01025237.1.p1  ORF type:complete len:417 (+),score=97.55 GFYU01025237.1:89-1252(+)
MTKCVIGAGSFALPKAMQEAGVVGGVVGMTLLAAVTVYTIKILIMSKNSMGPVLGQTLSYGQLTSAVIGPNVGKLVQVAIVCSCLGSCSAYCDFISTMMDEMTNGSISHVVVVGAVVAIEIPLALLRSFKYLSFTSILGDLCFTLAVVVILTDGFQNQTIHDPFGPEYDVWKWDTYPSFFGKAAFLFCIHFLVIPLQSSMAKPDTFETAVNRCYAFVTVLNVLFGLLGYLLWGQNVQDLVVSNLSAGPVCTVVKVCLIIDLLFTFPVVLAAARETVERAMIYDATPVSWGASLDAVLGIEGKRNVVRPVLVLLTGAFAVSIPNFSNVVNLVSGLALSFVGIILPPIIHTQLFKHTMPAWQKALNGAVMVLGLTACVSTTMQGIQALI